MKKYFVKVTSVATESNPNFAGETRIHIVGKGGEIYYPKQLPYIYDYGWSERRFAQSYIKKDRVEERESWVRFGHYWDNKYEILEYETEEEMENEALRMENILGL